MRLECPRPPSRNRLPFRDLRPRDIPYISLYRESLGKLDLDYNKSRSFFTETRFLRITSQPLEDSERLTILDSVASYRYSFRQGINAVSGKKSRGNIRNYHICRGTRLPLQDGGDSIGAFFRAGSEDILKAARRQVEVFGLPLQRGDHLPANFANESRSCQGHLVQTIAAANQESVLCSQP